MSVLTLGGKPIDWANPPSPTTKVLWSSRTTGGKPVIGSLRTIAHLDHLSTLAMKKYRVGVSVIQGPFNTTVAASAGTHDFDACSDVTITGVPYEEQSRFFRANGYACWVRQPPLFGWHIHGFTLPPREGIDVSDDFYSSGFKVGKYVDGGWSTARARITSSQIEDYYTHRTGLSGHAPDPTWFPPNIVATIFNLDAYIARQRKATAVKGADQIANLNSHGPLARLGGEAGQDLWDEWESDNRARITRHIRDILSVVWNGDTNKRPGIPNFGKGFRRLGGVAIDLIGFRRAVGGASVKVLKAKVVDLKIDGHNGHGSKLRVTFPSGKTLTYWNVTANIGRKGANPALVRTSLWALRKAFGKNAVYNFQEIDEADPSPEKAILREVFPAEHFAGSGMNTRVPTLVGKQKLRIVSSHVEDASPGLAMVSPDRVIVETLIAPK